MYLIQRFYKIVRLGSKFKLGRRNKRFIICIRMDIRVSCKKQSKNWSP